MLHQESVLPTTSRNEVARFPLLGSWTIVVHPTRKAVVDRGFPASQWDSLLDAHDERRTAPIDLRLVSAFLESRYEDIFLPLWW